MKFQSTDSLIALLILIAFVFRTQAGAQSVQCPTSQGSPSKHFSFKKIFQPDRWHGGIGITSCTLNANHSIGGGFTFDIGYDILKFKQSALTIETHPTIGEVDINWQDGAELALSFLSNNSNNYQTTSPGFFEAPLLLDYHQNFGSEEHGRPRFGFYLGGGGSYVVTAYQSRTNYHESATFWGYALNCGIRTGDLDIGFQKVISLRAPIDQIASPALYEFTVSARF